MHAAVGATVERWDATRPVHLVGHSFGGNTALVLVQLLADDYGVETFDHDPNVGGRFSVLSLVGLLPAMLGGVDAVAIREGAAAVLDQAFAGGDPAGIPAAMGVSTKLKRKKLLS